MSYLSRIAMRSTEANLQSSTAVLPQNVVAADDQDASGKHTEIASSDAATQQDNAARYENPVPFYPVAKSLTELNPLPAPEIENKNFPLKNQMESKLDHEQTAIPDYSYLKRFAERINSAVKEEHIRITKVESSSLVLVPETFSGQGDSEETTKRSFLSAPPSTQRESVGENRSIGKETRAEQLQMQQPMHPEYPSVSDQHIQQILPESKNVIALLPESKESDKNKVVIGRITVQVFPPASPQTVTKPQAKHRTSYASPKPGSEKINQLSFGLGQL